MKKGWLKGVIFSLFAFFVFGGGFYGYYYFECPYIEIRICSKSLKELWGKNHDFSGDEVLKKKVQEIYDEKFYYIISSRYFSFEPESVPEEMQKYFFVIDWCLSGSSSRGGSKGGPMFLENGDRVKTVIAFVKEEEKEIIKTIFLKKLPDSWKTLYWWNVVYEKK